MLFGSRARDDALAGSDYDVAVFLRDLPDRFAELDRFADLSTEIIADIGELIHAMPYRTEAYEDRTPLIPEIRREGVDL